MKRFFVGYRHLILMAGIASALGTAVVIDRRRPSSPGDRERPELVLPGLDRRRVTSVKVTLRSRSFRLENRAARASVVAVSATGANDPAARWVVLPDGGDREYIGRSSAVEVLLAAIENAAIDRHAASDAITGLDEPVAVIAIEGEGFGGPPRVIELGGRDASQRGVFVRASKAPSVVTSAYLAEVAERGPEAYRDARLLPQPRAFAGLVRLEVTTEEPRCRIERVGGLWYDTLRGIRVRREGVEAAIRSLAEGEAAAFAPVGSTTPSADAAGLTVSLTGPQAFFLTVKGAQDGDDGCPGDLHHASRRLNNTIEALCVDDRLLASVRTILAAACVRDPRLIAASVSEVTRATLVSPAGPRLILERGANGRWRLREPPVPWAIDEEAIEAWLAAVGELRLQTAKRPAPNATMATAPTTTLTVDTAEGSSETIHLYQSRHHGNPTTIVARAGESEPAVLATDASEQLAVDPARFRDRRPLSLAVHDLVRVRMSDAGAAGLTLTRRNDGTWQPTDPIPHSATKPAQDPTADSAAVESVDLGAIDDILAEVSNLRVERYLPSNTRLPERARRTIDLVEQRSGSATTHRLELFPGTDAGRGCTGRLATGPLVFTLAPDRCRLLLGEVARRAADTARPR